MKNRVIVVVLCLATVVAIGQQKWYPSMGSYTHTPWRGIRFFGSSGWLYGDHGLRRSEDQGVTWISLNGGIPETPALRDASFDSERHGWVLNFAGHILETQDAGSSWIDRTPNDLLTVEAGSSYLLQKIRFEKGTGLVYGFAFPGSTYEVGRPLKGFILSTKDAGHTWVRIEYNPFSMIDLELLDDGTAYLLSPREIRSSRDGMRSTSLYSDFSWDYFLKRLWLLNCEDAWALNQDGRYCTLIRTKDGGKSWQPTAVEGIEPREVYPLSGSEAWVAGNTEDYQASLLLFTSDSGQSWTTVFRGRYSQLIPFFTDQRHGWLVSFKPLLRGTEPEWARVLRTTDGGKNWTVTEIE